MIDDLVVIRTYEFRPLAEVDRSMLEACGIDAIILPSDVVGRGMVWWPDDPIRLLVRRRDEHEARRLLIVDATKTTDD
jgi:hypothetical protein